MMPKLYVHSDPSQLEDYARSVATDLNIHPGRIFHSIPEKSILTIDQAREIQDIALHTDQPTLIVIHEFDTAREDSQNALLKTLEDLTEHVVYILGVRDTSSILGTILSRCQVVTADATDLQDHGLIEKYGLQPESAGLSTYLSVSSAVSKEDAPLLIDELISAYRSLYLKRAYDGYVTIMRGLLDVRRHIIYAHVSIECAYDTVGYVLRSGARISG